MSVGTLFLVISFVLFFLSGIGMRTIPAIDTWAHAALVLGILLGAYPLNWWRPPP